MEDVLKSLNALLELESAMRDFYTAALDRVTIDRMEEDLKRIRDQEIGHVAMVKEMIRIAEGKGSPLEDRS